MKFFAAALALIVAPSFAMDAFEFTANDEISIPNQVYSATATYYTPAQGGTAICGREGGYCGAPSDGAQFWQGGTCSCGGSDPKCTQGYCYDCWNANLC